MKNRKYGRNDNDDDFLPPMGLFFYVLLGHVKELFSR